MNTNNNDKNKENQPDKFWYLNPTETLQQFKNQTVLKVLYELEQDQIFIYDKLKELKHKLIDHKERM